MPTCSAGVLVVLPMLFGLVLLGLLLLFFLVEGWRRRALGRPLLAMVAALPGSAALALAGHCDRRPDPRRRLLARPIPVVDRRPPSMPRRSPPASLALLLVARDAERTRLRAAFWLLFMLARRGDLRRSRRAARSISCCRRCVAALGMARDALAARRRAGRRDRARPCCSTSPSAPALGLFEELMSSGPLWVFAPLGAVDPAARADRAAAAARRVPRTRAGRARSACSCWLGRGGADPGLQRGPAAALHHRICLGRRRAAAAASRSTMTARRCRSTAAWAADRIALYDAPALGRAGAGDRRSPAPTVAAGRRSSRSRAAGGCGCASQPTAPRASP